MDPARTKKLEAAKRILDEYQKRRHSPISSSLQSSTDVHDRKDLQRTVSAKLNRNSNGEQSLQMADEVNPSVAITMHSNVSNSFGQSGESLAVTSEVIATSSDVNEVSANGTTVEELSRKLDSEIAAKERLSQELSVLYESYSNLRNVYEWLVRQQADSSEGRQEWSNANGGSNSVNYAEVLSVMVDEKSKLQSQLRQAMDLANAQKQENVLTEQELRTTVHSLELSQAELRRAQEELRRLESRTGQLEDQLKRKESEMTELDGLYRSTVEEKRELRCKLNVLVMENAKAEEIANNLKARISLQNGYQQASSGDVSSIEQQLAESEEKFVAADGENKRLIEEMDRLRSENEYLRSLRDSEVRELHETIKTLQNEKDSILLSRRDLEMDVQRLSSIVKDLQAHGVEREQHAVPAGNSGPEEGSHCSAQVAEAMRQQNSEINRLREALLAKETQLNSLAYEVQENSQCAQDYRAVLQQLHDERATSARAISQNVLLKGQLLELEKKFVEMSNTNAELATELDSANRVLAHHSADGCALNGSASSCRISLNSNSATDETHLLIGSSAAASKHYSIKERDNPATSPKVAVQQSDKTCLHLDSREGKASDVLTLSNLEDSVIEPEHPSTRSESYDPVVGATKDESFTEADLSVTNYSEDECHSNAIESLKKHVKELQESFNKALADNAELVSRNERLDHLVVQLQSETETIGEFITLYRHQRQVIQQRLCEREEYTAHVCREKELMKEKVAELRNLFTELLLEVGVLKNYALPAPSVRKPFRSEQSDIDPNGAISAGQTSETTSQDLPANTSATEEADGSNNAYSLAERMNSLLMELQKPELSNNMPPRDPQLHCKQCIGRMITL
ncbi:hypothetical protein M514_02597 [Trichuris suis]|uniref:Golgin subfamily A conserved domain-containing protein n=1 Tax=Trichuris suis TaxID=68888 RepID=A0A085NNH7_9BILA|nr:hypothetical protein M513_02597 [Trichuris suis]KFD71023.1 hypothetical protein M514_02597 [Trichuris suis]